MKNKRSLYVLFGLFALLLVCAPSCVSPGEFDQRIINRYQQTLAAQGPQPRSVGGLAPLAPAARMKEPPLRVVQDPSGKSLIYLSLDEAVMRALANSLDIRVLSYDPEISRQQAIQAAAQFDWILFGSTAYSKTDTPDLTGSDSQVRTLQYQVGVRQTNITGGTLQIAPTFTRTDSPGSLFTEGGVTWNSALQLQYVQPLLRNAGPEFNLAQLRIGQLNVQATDAQFRQRVEETLNTVINSYWALIQARYQVGIAQRLLDSTIETYNRIKERLKIDATYVELKQSEAAVEARRAILFRAQKNAADAQDQLARLLSDEQINLLTKYEIVPSTSPAVVPLHIDPADQLVLALGNSPILEQARLAISAAQINVRVAQNQTLPRLDLQATGNIGGIDRNLSQSVDDAASFDNIGYSLALLVEYPIGNRAARAELARQKFQRLQAITQLQNVADQLAQQINERIRQVDTAYQEMQAQESAIKASAAQLEALQNTEEIRGRLTPEFLQVKLSAQENLATAETGKLAAVVNYNAALADLARLTGTSLSQHGVDIRKMPAAIGEQPWLEEIVPQRPATLPSVPTATERAVALPPPGPDTLPTEE